MFCHFIPFVIVLSLYTFCCYRYIFLFIPFVVMHFVVIFFVFLYILSLYVLLLYVSSKNRPRVELFMFSLFSLTALEKNLESFQNKISVVLHYGNGLAL